MSEQPNFDSNQAVDRLQKMWLALAEQIETAIPNHVIANDPVAAMRWATYAEACFWKATGEGDSHDLKDVLP